MVLRQGTETRRSKQKIIKRHTNQLNYNPSDSIHHNTSRAKMTMMMNCCYFRRRRGARAQHEGSGHLYQLWTSPEGNYSSKSNKHSQYPGITDLSHFLRDLVTHLLHSGLSLAQRKHKGASHVIRKQKVIILSANPLY